MIISACLLALSCSKAMPDEAVVVPAGEKVTFTIPETKVTIGADEGNGTRKYAFEEGDVVYAVTTGGSVAAMEFKGENTFAGEFSKPVGTDEKISLYYNCYSAENNAPAYVQNGKPWLVSSDNGYSRDDNNTIILSATLDAPKGVTGLPVISRFECTIDFHAKNGNISIASFDGTSFSGGNAVTGISLKAATGDEYAAIVNVPAGMEGGFWIKAVKGQQSMYKSTSATVGRKSFIMNEFTPAAVSIDVQISGFPTSYSYYIANEGIDGISEKDVSTANSVSNDWMGEGKAVCTITKSGIPSTLLSVKSVSLFVNGAEFSGVTYTEGSDNTITISETTGHTTWEQKNITAKVVYTTPDGLEFESNVSNTLTRHITGLPYMGENLKSTSLGWTLDHSDYAKLSDEGLILETPYLGRNSKATLSFNIPENTDVTLFVYNAVVNSRKGGRTQSTSKVNISIGSTHKSSVFSGPDISGFIWGIKEDTRTYSTTKIDDSSLNTANNGISIEQATGSMSGIYAKIGGIKVEYR